MTAYPLKLEEIVAWYRSKQDALTSSGISVVGITERTEQTPAAAADFAGANSMGRINGWVSGEFDFEAVRVSDGADLFWEHVDVAAIQDLETAYSNFLRHLSAPDISTGNAE